VADNVNSLRVEGKIGILDNMTAWSYSSIKTFDQCPKKYFHLKVVKDVKDEPGEAADYGTAVHEAAEHVHHARGTHPREVCLHAPVVEPLARKQGTKYAEIKLGVAKIGDEYSPVASSTRTSGIGASQTC
jgi:hypothetical protein